MGVSPNQSSGAELDPAEITGDYHADIDQVIFFQDFQHRHAGCSTWFAIIAASLDLIFFANDEGTAVMVCFPMFFFDTLDKCFGFFFTGHSFQVTEKAGFFDFSLRQAIGFNRFISCLHLLTLSLLALV